MDGRTYWEQYSFDVYNEAHSLKRMVQAFFNRMGHDPQRVLADKSYRNRENISPAFAGGAQWSLSRLITKLCDRWVVLPPDNRKPLHHDGAGAGGMFC